MFPCAKYLVLSVLHIHHSSNQTFFFMVLVSSLSFCVSFNILVARLCRTGMMDDTVM